MAPTIEIGPFRYGLHGLDPSMTRDVHVRYGRFLVDRPENFHFDLRIAGTGAHQPGEMPLVETVGDRAYHVTYGSLTVELDLKARRGSAAILSTVYIIDSLLRITTTLLGLEEDALLLHSSGVLLEAERALVSFGPSGVGKTTVARSMPPERVLCDEMILLSFDEAGRLIGNGTPFHGDLPTCQPGRAEVFALVQLIQGTREELTALSHAKAAQALLGAVLFFCREPALVERLFALAVRVCFGRTYTLTFKRETHVPTFVESQLKAASDRPAARPNARP